MNALAPDQLEQATGGRWLRRPPQDVTPTGVGIDTRADLAGRVFVAIRGDRHDGHDFIEHAAAAGAAILVVQTDRELPSAPDGVGVLEVDDTRRALGRLARAHRRTLVDTRVIAVTGSVGKTTTKRLIHGALGAAHHGSAARRSFNNEIGVPLTLLAARPEHHYVVVEVGTSAPGEIAELASMVEPDVAVITAVGRSHLEQLGTVEAVAAEKASLLTHLRPGGIAIVPADTDLLDGVLPSGLAVTTFGISPHADLRLTARGRAEGESWWIEIDGRDRFTISLPGRHNAGNALAAVAVARHFDVSPEQIAAGLVSVRPAEQRFTTTTLGEVTIHDDAYNANPESVRAVLDVFIELAAKATRRIVVLGDMLELGDAAPALHREVGSYVVEVNRHCDISHAILVGEASRHAAVEISGALGGERTVEVDDAAAAGRRLAEIVRPGDAVLLKASRGVGLERVIDELRDRIASGR